MVPQQAEREKENKLSLNFLLILLQSPMNCKLNHYGYDIKDNPTQCNGSTAKHLSCSMKYRVSYIEMSVFKWFCGVEGSIILLILPYMHVQ